MAESTSPEAAAESVTVVLGAKVLQLGITFKENCTDIRNSHAVDVVRGLQEFGCKVDVYDPWAAPEEVRLEYGIRSTQKISDSTSYDAIILAVAHREFTHFDFEKIRTSNSIVFDIKGVIPRKYVDGRL